RGIHRGFGGCIDRLVCRLRTGGAVAVGWGVRFAAGLTRSAGTLAIIPLAIIAWRTWRTGRARRTPWPVLISPLGTLGYWFWLRQTGRPSVVAAYRNYWSTEVAGP